MGFAQVGSTIKQTNDSPISITGISSHPLGFTVTTAVAHGYSNAQFVEILGTTDYNHSFQISGVTSTTFNCTDQRYTFTSSQTGTCEKGDINMAALSALTGVTTITQGGMTIYNVGSNVVEVEGSWRIDPRNEILMSGVGPGAVVVQNGGQLYLGKPLVESSYYYSNPLTVYINTGTPTFFYYPSNITATPEGALCVMDSTSALYWEDCALQLTTFGSGTAGNGIQFVNDCRIFIRNGKIAARGASHSFSGIRTANLDIIGFEFVNSTLIWGSEVAGNEPIGFKLIGSDDGVFGYDGNYTWRNLEVANQGNGADILIWTDFPVTNLVQQKALNNETGNNIKIKGATTTSDSRNKGYNTVAKEVALVVSEQDGTVIASGAKYYIRDTNNAQRKNLNSIDDTADKIYTGTYSALGESGTVEVVTAIVNVASTTSTPAAGSDPIGNTTANTGVYRVDFRGKSDTTLTPSPDNQTDFNNTAKFDILNVDYSHRMSVFEGLFSGHDELLISMTMINEQYVVLSKAAASALTKFSFGPRIEAQTISFTGNNTITDSGSGFGSFTSGMQIRIKGTSSNDGNYTINTASASTITTVETTITTESAGYSVRIFNPKITVDANATISEMFDYTRYYESQNPDVCWDNDFNHILTTSDGSNFTSIYDIEVDTNVLTGDGILDLGANTLTEVGGGFYDGVFTDSSGYQISIKASNIIDGSRYQIYNITQDTELDNDLVSGGNGVFYRAKFGAGQEVEKDDEIRLRVTYTSGSSAAKIELENSIVSLGGEISFANTQSDDSVYTTWAIDGSAITEFSADFPNVQVDINDGDGETTKKRLGAWLKYIVTTEDGIRNFFGSIITNTVADIKIDQSIVDLKLDNVSGSELYFTDTDVRLYRSDLSQIIASGSGSIFLDYEGVPFVAETNTTGLTAEESAKLDAALKRNEYIALK